MTSRASKQPTPKSKAGNKRANARDQFIGARIKLARKSAEMSQEALAKRFGLSFQQFQKYEMGTNRVVASRLYEIAQILRVPITYFFEGIDDVLADVPSSPAIQSVQSASELRQIADDIKDERLRARVMKALRLDTKADTTES